MPLVDLTSSLYLGFTHPSAALRGWSTLTTGGPAALGLPRGAAQVGERLAELQGCEAATLVPSTLHAFWDLFGFLPDRGSRVYVDTGAYPVSTWGLVRAAARGARIETFAHHDGAALRRMVARGGEPPVVVTDGFCPGCGRAAPIAEYLDCAAESGGWLVIDDAQALGVLGTRGSPRSIALPYGRRGGGSLRWHGVEGRRAVVVASLAKAFGAPLAVVAGSRRMMDRFDATSDTRVYTSPVSAAAVSAAEHALDANARHGDVLRKRLADNVTRFVRAMARVGCVTSGGIFPVQALSVGSASQAVALHEGLLREGVRTVLVRGRCGEARGRPRVAFILTASTRPEEIRRAVDAISRCTLAATAVARFG